MFFEAPLRRGSTFAERAACLRDISHLVSERKKDGLSAVLKCYDNKEVDSFLVLPVE